MAALSPYVLFFFLDFDSQGSSRYGQLLTIIERTGVVEFVFPLHLTIQDLSLSLSAFNEMRTRPFQDCMAHGSSHVPPNVRS